MGYEAGVQEVEQNVKHCCSNDQYINMNSTWNGTNNIIMSFEFCFMTVKQTNLESVLFHCCSVINPVHKV